MKRTRGDSLSNRLALIAGSLLGIPESVLLLITAIRHRREFAASQWGAS